MQIHTIMRIKKNDEYYLHAEFIDFQINQYTVQFFMLILGRSARSLFLLGEK